MHVNGVPTSWQTYFSVIPLPFCNLYSACFAGVKPHFLVMKDFPSFLNFRDHYFGIFNPFKASFSFFCSFQVDFKRWSKTCYRRVQSPGSQAPIKDKNGFLSFEVTSSQSSAFLNVFKLKSAKFTCSSLFRFFCVCIVSQVGPVLQPLLLYCYYFLLFWSFKNSI